MRLMALDVGSRTIGVACSDALGITAQGVTTIRRESYKKDFAQLASVFLQRDVTEAVELVDIYRY